MITRKTKGDRLEPGKLLRSPFDPSIRIFIMTYTKYSQQQLQKKTLPQLRQTYAEIGCTVAIQDKRRKNEWINAIINHQST
ncbi:hypothetical protein H6G80_33000 [Nostoc sp. FACHB-87]|uniref:hypothetical protein n=1 Tax=Nostocaceae TaxID=1162 RepID=UPI001684DBE4|nr:MULTISPECIES: hypothetical protein [Nostocaceae]MBD2458860.1 hypothetical protein [Nostoc sp. FACHB-87]MBD2479899.1 hypothetical protein [Anabaena sp. FACHB-83]